MKRILMSVMMAMSGAANAGDFVLDRIKAEEVLDAALAEAEMPAVPQRIYERKREDIALDCVAALAAIHPNWSSYDLNSVCAHPNNSGNCAAALSEVHPNWGASELHDACKGTGAGCVASLARQHPIWGPLELNESCTDDLYYPTEMKTVIFTSQGYELATEAGKAMDFALGQLRSAHYPLVERYFQADRAGYILRFQAPALGSLRSASGTCNTREECKQAAEASTLTLISQGMVVLEKYTRFSFFNFSFIVAYYNPYF